MRCEVCQAHPTVRPLFRVNEKGVTGRWRCEMHPPKPGECCCNYLFDRMCSYHEHVLLGENDIIDKIVRPETS